MIRVLGEKWLSWTKSYTIFNPWNGWVLNSGGWEPLKDLKMFLMTLKDDFGCFVVWWSDAVFYQQRFNSLIHQLSLLIKESITIIIIIIINNNNNNTK